MNDPIAILIAQILKQAEERKFVYPLRITIEAADGEKQVYKFPAPGQDPSLIESTLDADTGMLIFPAMLVAEDSTLPRKELRFRITAEAESESAGGLLLEMEDDQEENAPLQHRRSTKDLIRELDEESFFHDIVVLVVGFENTTIFVESTDPRRLEMLNDAVRVGGNPIGLIAADREDEHLKVSRKIFPGSSAHVEQYDEYFDRLSDSPFLPWFLFIHTGELEGMLKAKIESRSRQPGDEPC